MWRRQRQPTTTARVPMPRRHRPSEPSIHFFFFVIHTSYLIAFLGHRPIDQSGQLFTVGTHPRYRITFQSHREEPLKPDQAFNPAKSDALSKSTSSLAKTFLFRAIIITTTQGHLTYLSCTLSQHGQPRITNHLSGHSRPTKPRSIIFFPRLKNMES